MLSDLVFWRLVLYQSSFEFSFAVGAFAALFHDILICIGVVIMCGTELSLIHVGAFLTIAGYSINDTIVVFDRMRESLRSKRGDVAQVMNLAIKRNSLPNHSNLGHHLRGCPRSLGLWRIGSQGLLIRHHDRRSYRKPTPLSSLRHLSSTFGVKKAVNFDKSLLMPRSIFRPKLPSQRPANRAGHTF